MVFDGINDKRLAGSVEDHIRNMLAADKKAAQERQVEESKKVAQHYADMQPADVQKALKESVELQETAPPNEKLKGWTEKRKVKAAFKKEYGEDWKAVMYGHAWNMYKKGQGMSEQVDFTEEAIMNELPEQLRLTIESCSKEMGEEGEKNDE